MTLYIYAGAIASVLLVCLILFVVWRNRRRRMAVQAAEAFRSKVLSELTGLYPIPRYLDKDKCDKFIATVPGIKSAAARFIDFVPSRDRKAFNTALETYCDHCSKITWEACATYNAFTGKRKPDDIGPKEVFRQNVNALLAFTKKEPAGD